jgi:phosphatidate phosphatase APP1
MPSPLVLICDIDETICTEFDRPVLMGVELLRRLAKSQLEVHYVTARPEETRAATEEFLLTHKLPYSRNLYLCPRHKGSMRHKREVTEKIKRESRIVLSIGDSDEEEIASKDHNVPFLRIDPEDFETSWKKVALELKAYLR